MGEEIFHTHSTQCAARRRAVVQSQPRRRALTKPLPPPAAGREDVRSGKSVAGNGAREMLAVLSLCATVLLGLAARLDQYQKHDETGSRGTSEYLFFRGGLVLRAHLSSARYLNHTFFAEPNSVSERARATPRVRARESLFSEVRHSVG